MEREHRDWETQKRLYGELLSQARGRGVVGGGKTVPPERAVALLETVIRPGDRVALEGNNQKQAEFLAAALCQVDPARVHDLHMVQSVIALPEHTELFARGIASRVDFSYAGPQAVRVLELVRGGRMKIGEIHTYLELFSRYFLDLTPQVALVTGVLADGQGNLYTGPNTEDTPVIVEATHFRHGIVVAQVERVVSDLPRVDIPGDWVDFVVPTGKPCYLEPLFPRDPARIRTNHI
ncbi:MAG: malonate decarboxylase subunit alpha, partial [Syntrophales bacterium]|nr:malonate decarboxylase subunit alpha [Syntrophales bacterium]